MADVWTFRNIVNSSFIPGLMVRDLVSMAKQYDLGALVDFTSDYTRNDNEESQGWWIYENFWSAAMTAVNVGSYTMVLPAQAGKRYVINNISTSCTALTSDGQNFAIIYDGAVGDPVLFSETNATVDNKGYSSSIGNFAIIGSVNTDLTFRVRCLGGGSPGAPKINANGFFISG